MTQAFADDIQQRFLFIFWTDNAQAFAFLFSVILFPLSAPSLASSWIPISGRIETVIIVELFDQGMQNLDLSLHLTQFLAAGEVLNIVAVLIHPAVRGTGFPYPRPG